MSVEFTTMATDTLPVNPKTAQGNNQQTINNLADTDQSIENKFMTAKETLEVEQISNKEIQDEESALSTPQLEKVAKQLQEFIGKMNQGLEFSVDEDSGRDVIKVIDRKSGEVIKQYPSEEVLSLVAKLSEATGNFVDSKV
ncbi:flagellar protein FlaG [Colwellia psychrerythraea]|uniref:Flagellar protein FlaG protein n=1 Tax=Colwellia psychrerythraea TaxID=28229 RepID=A0A099L212_COLPS|nr:flagellar protein FlaG [Colwellia psychrerythraea]KGJ96999.1 flagellar protein FlaG protein [Colwellia psychrerythraea]